MLSRFFRHTSSFLGLCVVAGCSISAGDDPPLSSSPTSQPGGPGESNGNGTPAAPSKSDPNFATDALNCGSKGHDCLGGACVAGQCQSVSVSPDGIFGDGPWLKGDDVYVAGYVKDGANALWLFPSSGAPPSSVSSNAFKGYLNQHPLLMGTWTYALIDSSKGMLFGNFDYASSGSTHQGILTINVTNGAVEKMVDTPLSGMQRGAPFAIDATHVYWADSIALHRRALGGGPIQDLPTPAITYDIVAMASDASALYLAAEYDVFRYDKVDGKVTPVLKTLYRVRQVAVSDKSVYASDVARTGCSDPQAPGSVWGAPKGGTSSAATKRLVKSNNNVTSLSASLAAGSDRVFWFDECTGDVHSTTSAGEDRIVSKGTGADTDGVVAKASKVLYWRAGNKLWKLAD